MKRLFFIFVTSCFCSFLYADDSSDSLSLSDAFIEDALTADSFLTSAPDSIIEMAERDYPEALEKNLNSLLGMYHNTVLVSDCTSDSIAPQIDDDLTMKRLQKIPALFELVYNPIVKKYIELYTIRRRKQMEYMLGVGMYYFPIFEQALDAANMPMELKYLPVIESALNPRAFSVAGASGLWQFMYGTGKIYGLQGNSLIDERRDPIKSTYAAVRYLKDLYRIYSDWALVIAAYNCGPGNVNKAIKRSNGKRDYWAIYPYLPKETRGYVPAFIAATYAMTYYKEHGICPARVELPVVCDTIRLNERLHLAQIAEVMNVNIDVLRSLNPQYRRDIIPGNGETYTLCLPQVEIEKFIEMKDSIVAYKADSFNVLTRVKVLPASADPYFKGKGTVSGGKYHVVKKGQTLSSISRMYKIPVDKIKRLNNLKKDNIYIGQKLRIR
jgi:membrane-bound lytic murein transglycosylase D